MCGEKDKAKEMGATTKGSPPRVRGKARDGDIDNMNLGITPACAGKRRGRGRERERRQDHPSVCGEKYGRKTAMAFQYGITPACAGKSFRDNLVSRQLQDHPRACGEKPQWAPITLLMLGSPPHMRGKERRQYMAQLGPGITPACAGKRLRAQSGCKTLGDHPRVCGEKAARVDRPEKGQGSPPRVRGKVPSSI